MRIWIIRGNRECSRAQLRPINIRRDAEWNAQIRWRKLIESDARWFQLPECETIPFGSRDRAESNQRYDKQVDPWMTLEQRRTEFTAKYDFTGVHLRGATKPGLTAEKTRRQLQFGNRDWSMTEPQEIRCRRTIQQRSHWELNTGAARIPVRTIHTYRFREDGIVIHVVR